MWYRGVALTRKTGLTDGLVINIIPSATRLNDRTPKLFLFLNSAGRYLQNEQGDFFLTFVMLFTTLYGELL